MVVFSLLYLVHAPFAVYEGGMITGIVKSLGPLPEELKGIDVSSKTFDSWYDQDQTPNPDEDPASKFARYSPGADLVEQQHVYSIMSKVFVYDPESVSPQHSFCRALNSELWTDMPVEFPLIAFNDSPKSFLGTNHQPVVLSSGFYCFALP
jgi:hypothetical protein